MFYRSTDNVHWQPKIAWLDSREIPVSLESFPGEVSICLGISIVIEKTSRQLGHDEILTLLGDALVTTEAASVGSEI